MPNDACHKSTFDPTDDVISYGVGQLSLIEHSLSPLAAGIDTAKGLKHESHYRFTDRAGARRTANVKILAPLGLTATDEFYLWGLLALTLSQPSPTTEFHATPHYCLRQLGIIDQHGRRGGRQYQLFARSLERLSAVTYQNDGFYDPIRKEHRRVAFGFLSYSLPLSDTSSRAWRILWDSVYFEMATAIGGHLRFDLDIYRRLDAASRRLFLYASKYFWRRKDMPSVELRFLGEQVLGFAPTHETRELRRKVTRCIERLVALTVVEPNERPIRKNGRGFDTVQLTRGKHFCRDQRKAVCKSGPVESPLAELMREIGLDARTIRKFLREIPNSILREWLDITLAARERMGESFFRKNPAAYFIDNVRHAAAGQRTSPDWWHELRKEELRAKANFGRKQRAQKIPQPTGDSASDLTATLSRCFQSVGQSEQMAEANAQKFSQSVAADSDSSKIASILKLLS